MLLANLAPFRRHTPRSDVLSLDVPILARSAAISVDSSALFHMYKARASDVDENLGALHQPLHPEIDDNGADSTDGKGGLLEVVAQIKDTSASSRRRNRDCTSATVSIERDNQLWQIHGGTVELTTYRS
jgi:hypothetical protein